MNASRFYIPIVCMFSFACGTNQVFIDQANIVKISKSDFAKCAFLGEFKQYTWLYGSYSINEPKFQSEKYRKFRIEEKVTPQDLLVTIPLGLLFSIGRKTYIYEDCGSYPAVETEFIVQERTKILTEIEREYKDLPQMLAERAKRELGEKFSKTLPLIWFMDGSLKQGKVVSQDSEIIEIEDGDGAKQKYYRRDILKIRYILE
ncbi:hypothetical protein P3G55_22885 [Leptospira sp. 96542]|nr:hypothetical protein [Leptospira sp. 96542]